MVHPLGDTLFGYELHPLDPDWLDPHWQTFFSVCLAGWIVIWNVLPEDKVVPSGAPQPATQPGPSRSSPANP